MCSVPSYSISVALMEIYFASEQTEHKLLSYKPGLWPRSVRRNY